MKATIGGLGALLLAGLASPVALAQVPSYPQPYPQPSAPQFVPGYQPPCPQAYVPPREAPLPPYAQFIGGPRPPAPDACGSWSIAVDEFGCPRPIYCVRPPWEPFNGLRPCLQGGGQLPPGPINPQMAPQLAGLPPPASFPMPQAQHAGQPALASFPTHPFCRSPRDFFMWTEAMEDQAMRARLPILAP
jgi:hypothetical protein